MSLSPKLTGFKIIGSMCLLSFMMEYDSTKKLLLSWKLLNNFYFYVTHMSFINL